MSTLTTGQFREIAQIAQEAWGLELTDRKRALVQNRLSKLISRSHYRSIAEYLDHLRQEMTEQDMLVFFDALSTNTTSFFREEQHFRHLAETLYPRLGQAPAGTRVRIWSAACSDGSEPYTIAVHAAHHLTNIDRLDFRILATDLSGKSLERARAAVYPARALESVPASMRRVSFERCGEDGGGPTYRVAPAVRRLVSIHQLNLMGEWPMRGPFDVVFLRNVMIYFNRPTRERLVRRMRTLLGDDGLLVIGSSETLSGIDSGLRMVRPSVYTKGGPA